MGIERTNEHAARQFCDLRVTTERGTDEFPGTFDLHNLASYDKIRRMPDTENVDLSGLTENWGDAMMEPLT